MSNIQALNYSEAEKADWTPQDHAHHKRLLEEQTFGAGFKRDAKGSPIEQGIGSPSNMTGQAKAALEKHKLEQAALKAKAGL